MNNNSHEFAELKTEIGRCHTAIIHTNIFKDGFTTILMPCTRFNSKVVSKMEIFNCKNHLQTRNHGNPNVEYAYH